MTNKKIHEEANIFENNEEEIYLIQEMCDSGGNENEHSEGKVSVLKKKDDFKITTG